MRRDLPPLTDGQQPAGKCPHDITSADILKWIGKSSLRQTHEPLQGRDSPRLETRTIPLWLCDARASPLFERGSLTSGAYEAGKMVIPTAT